MREVDDCLQHRGSLQALGGSLRRGRELTAPALSASLDDQVESFQTRVAKRAPELRGALAWLNVDEPLSLRELRGNVVVLDFWTYCCVNCMHVQPTLRELARRHAADPFLVIGVHSGKFTAERDPERIRDAIGRYGVEHPVAVDDDMAIWSRYGVRSWPTLVVVRPDGTVAAVAPGEPDLETLDRFISDELSAARARGLAAEAPPEVARRLRADHQPLFYPGKAAVLPDGRLAIADSGHHRVLVCEADGRAVLAVGSGMRGHADGSVADAAFDDPQGMCWHDGALYVADARNHAIRRVDLEGGVVSTVAGTGALGGDLPTVVSDATKTALRSPWDLCSVGELIYVAMAGSHQLCRLDPAKGTIEVWAGTGIEALLDGEVAQSAWAQPSGLSSSGATLYVADSETSAIRAVDMQAGQVSTLVGLGLFDFGDADGGGDAALLQHPLGVAAVQDGVLIADTYNGKIKRWRASDQSIVTVLDGLSEPGSIEVTTDGMWIVADTNAHRVLGVREGVVSQLAIREAPAPQSGALEARGSRPEMSPAAQGWFTTLLDLPVGTGLSPGEGHIDVALEMPAGAELSEGSPLRIRTEVSRRGDLLLLGEPDVERHAVGGRTQRLTIPVRVTSLSAPVIEAEMVSTIDYVMCRSDDKAACFPARLHLRLPVRLLSDGGQPRLEFEVEGPELSASELPGS